MKIQSTKVEILRFLVAGSCAVATDFTLYFLLVKIVTHSPAKAASFIGGSVVAYIINKYWTFKKKEKSFTEVASFALLYVSTLAVNVSVNKLTLLVSRRNLLLAFLIATATSTVLNFLGQKLWVFRRRRVCAK